MHQRDYATQFCTVYGLRVPLLRAYMLTRSPIPHPSQVLGTSMSHVFAELPVDSKKLRLMSQCGGDFQQVGDVTNKRTPANKAKFVVYSNAAHVHEG